MISLHHLQSAALLQIHTSMVGKLQLALATAADEVASLLLVWRACAFHFPCVALGRMDFAFWLLAWDRYALAAAATEQMPYQLAMTHRNIIAGIAIDAIAEGKSTQVAVVYDELSRRACLSQCSPQSFCVLCFPQERVGERVRQPRCQF